MRPDQGAETSIDPRFWRELADSIEIVNNLIYLLLVSTHDAESSGCLLQFPSWK